MSKLKSNKLAALQLVRSAQKNGIFSDVLDVLSEGADLYSAFDPRVAPFVGAAKMARKSPFGKRLENKVDKFVSRRSSKSRTPMEQLVKTEAKEMKMVSEAARASTAQAGGRRGAPPIANMARPVTTVRDRTGVRVVTGCEPVKTLTAPGSGYAAGDKMFEAIINPTNPDLSCPRLRRSCKGYERYRISGRFILQAAAGTDAPGSMITYIDRDPADASTLSSSGESNISRALAHKDAVVSTVYQRVEVPLTLDRLSNFLYVDNDESDIRFTSMGRIFVVCMTPIAANTDVGVLFFDWKLELLQPQEDQSIPTGDFWQADYHGAMTNSTSGAMLTGRTVGTYSNIDVVQSDEDMKLGKLKLPPGSYMISGFIQSSDSKLGGYSGVNVFSVETPGLINPVFTRKTSEGTAGTLVRTQVSTWVTGVEPFYVYLTTYGNWDAATIWINATTASPFASTFGKTRALMKRSKELDEAERQIASVKTSQTSGSIQPASISRSQTIQNSEIGRSASTSSTSSGAVGPYVLVNRY